MKSWSTKTEQKYANEWFPIHECICDGSPKYHRVPPQIDFPRWCNSILAALVLLLHTAVSILPTSACHHHNNLSTCEECWQCLDNLIAPTHLVEAKCDLKQRFSSQHLRVMRKYVLVFEITKWELLYQHNYLSRHWDLTCNGARIWMGPGCQWSHTLKPC